MDPTEPTMTESVWSSFMAVRIYQEEIVWVSYMMLTVGVLQTLAAVIVSTHMKTYL